MEVLVSLSIFTLKPGVQRSAAQQRLVQMILPEEQIRPVVASSRSRSTQNLDCVSELSAAELQVMWSALDQEKLFM